MVHAPKSSLQHNLQQPGHGSKCPSIEEWIKKMRYNEILFSHKKQQKCAICRDVDGPIDCNKE